MQAIVSRPPKRIIRLRRERPLGWFIEEWSFGISWSAENSLFMLTTWLSYTWLQNNPLREDWPDGCYCYRNSSSTSIIGREHNKPLPIISVNSNQVNQPKAPQTTSRMQKCSESTRLILIRTPGTCGWMVSYTFSPRVSFLSTGQ